MSEELSFDVTYIRIRSFDLVRSESFYRADFHDPDDNIWTLVGSWDDA